MTMITEIYQVSILAEKAFNFFFQEEEENNSLLENLVERLNFSGLNVSFWSHCCYADGSMSEEEDELTDEMILSFFLEDAIFSEEVIKVFYQNELTVYEKPVSKEVIAKYLIDCFNEPVSISEVVDVASQNPEIAYNFYEQACLIFSIDEELSQDEREFLDDLSEEFKLSKIDKRSIEKKHLKHLEKDNNKIANSSNNIENKVIENELKILAEKEIVYQDQEENPNNNKRKKRTFWGRLKRSFARLFSEISHFFKSLFRDDN